MQEVALQVLPKILGDRPVPALDPAAEVQHGGQRPQSALARRRLRLLEDAFPHAVVLPGVEQAAFGFQAIAPGPAALLLVMLQRLGHAGVNHVPHVGLVDAHAEGHRGDDRVDLLFDERFLVAAAVIVRQAGMVRPHAVAQFLQHGRGLLHVLARNAIDDARLARVPVQDFPDLLQAVMAALDLVDQIRPVERADQDFGRGQLQLLRDILPDLFGRGRGVGMDADVGESFLQDPQPAVLRAEIVPPGTDAVGLVDRHQRDAGGLEELQRAFRQQAFRGQVEQPQPARAGPRRPRAAARRPTACC